MRILIKSLEYDIIRTDERFINYEKFIDDNEIVAGTLYNNFSIDAPNFEIKRENILMDVFFNEYGAEHHIGMTEEVKKILNLPLRCISDLCDDLYDSRITIRNLESNLKKSNDYLHTIKSAGFLRKLKWLFSEVK